MIEDESAGRREPCGLTADPDYRGANDISRCIRARRKSTRDYPGGINLVAVIRKGFSSDPVPGRAKYTTGHGGKENATRASRRILVPH